jgi:ABC-type transporter Mla subunit MlaD
MTEPTNRWKLGLFVVLGIALGVGALVFIGTIQLDGEGVIYRSYFDESVTALEPGAAVRFRGVRIGRIASVGIGPDQRHVSVAYEIEPEHAERLGWLGGADKSRYAVPDTLRAKLESLGVTGVKYLQLDYFDPERYPRRELPFDAGPETIPSIPSTLASLEDALLRFASSFPAIAERTLAVLDQIHGLLEPLAQAQLSERTVSVLGRMDETLVTLNTQLRSIPVKQLSGDLHDTATQVNVTLGQVQQLLARMDGSQGLLASVQRASDSVGDMAGRTRGMSSDLDGAVQDFRSLAQTLQSFVDALERDPDMLLKGRAEPSR